MDSRNPQNRPSGRTPAVVEAASLKDALRLVRQRYGADARVIRSRTLNRRQDLGLGRQRVVEVLVEPGSEIPTTVAPTGRAGRDDPWRDLSGDIAGEVERIEGLVRQITSVRASRAWAHDGEVPHGAAARLVDGGAQPGLVVRWCERCQAETGARLDDQAAFIAHLRKNLPVGSHVSWDDFAGVHVVLGPAGGGRTSLVESTAARLARDGRSLLVLGLLPEHEGEIRRLQAAAATGGYDAAVIQKSRQFAAAREHLAAYDVVLVDGPDLARSASSDHADLRTQIVADSSLHRHFVCPVDRDPRDLRPLVEAARRGNCDWLALTRLDQTTLHAKILDLVDQIALPISLISDPDGSGRDPQLADADQLVSLLLAGTSDRARAEG